VAEPTILDKIVARRRLDVAQARKDVPFPALQERLRAAPPPLDFVARMRRESFPGRTMALIAEVKRASPSKGDIAPGIDAAALALTYAKAGAAGISILTEPTWFKGTLDDMLGARLAVDVLDSARPGILRKDFIIDDYQVVEARAFGADSVLLIVASLDDAWLSGLIECSRSMNMEPLVEVNNAAEMDRAIAAGATLIGVNNRDLRDFSVDLGTTERLAGMVPNGTVLVALSGINERADVERFAAAGVVAVLVGESLMRAPDPAAKIRELVGR
jgi:anthranilate synthase/indole-3-glycerol phosphate synthase/phosphoribosylanthranilate isomerase